MLEKERIVSELFFTIQIYLLIENKILADLVQDTTLYDIKSKN